MKRLVMDLNYPNRHVKEISVLSVVDAKGTVIDITFIKPFETIVEFQEELQKHIDRYKVRYPGVKVVDETNGLKFHKPTTKTDRIKLYGLNNKIEWKNPSPQAYDGSEIDRTRLDGYGLYE